MLLFPLFSRPASLSLEKIEGNASTAGIRSPVPAFLGDPGTWRFSIFDSSRNASSEFGQLTGEYVCVGRSRLKSSGKAAAFSSDAGLPFVRSLLRIFRRSRLAAKHKGLTMYTMLLTTALDITLFARNKCETKEMMSAVGRYVKRVYSRSEPIQWHSGQKRDTHDGHYSGAR